MADLKPAPGVRARSIRLDMTPLVDLAFLLLSFFILATTMLRTEALQLVLPPEGTGGEAQGAITVLLTPAGIHHYTGTLQAEGPAPSRTTAQGLRQVLLAHRQAHPQGVCIVRTAPGTRYREVIAVLDELAICGIGRYTVTEDLLPTERQRLPALAAAP
jgi:biopolymer transport protein ExbD